MRCPVLHPHYHALSSTETRTPGTNCAPPTLRLVLTARMLLPGLQYIVDPNKHACQDCPQGHVPLCSYVFARRCPVLTYARLLPGWPLGCDTWVESLIAPDDQSVWVNDTDLVQLCAMFLRACYAMPDGLPMPSPVLT
eukprot:320368-Rhodomonas_salina.4